MWTKLITIWNNKWHIFLGIKNWIFKKNYIEKIAIERMKICNNCPSIDIEGIKCMLPGSHPCCGKCGCSLALKVRDLTSGCGDLDNPKWNQVKSVE